MLNLNPLSGLLSTEDGPVEDGSVLLYLERHVVIDEAQRVPFTMQSMNRVFTRYPSLALINDYVSAFQDAAAQIKPKLSFAVSDAPASRTHLLMQWNKFVTYSELTLKHVDYVDITDEFSAARGSNPKTRIELRFDDKPSMTIKGSLDITFAAGDDESESLSATRLDEVFRTPIKIRNARTEFIHKFANQARDGEDRAREYADVFISDASEISLRELVHNVAWALDLSTDEELSEREIVSQALEEVERQERERNGDNKDTNPNE